MTDETKEVFDVHLDPQTLTLLGNIRKNLPSWTKLDFHQCPHCPFTISTNPFCPLSVNLVNIVERLGRLVSYDKIHVEVLTRERRVSQNVTAQEGISSLMGLVIATTDCPHTDFFKPMARFHLPFANEVETVWRTISTYLIAQYLLIIAGLRKNPDLKELTTIFSNIEILNTAIVKRLRAASKKDSTVNALVHLDVFAKHFILALEESLESLYHIFAPFLSKYTDGNKKGGILY